MSSISKIRDEWQGELEDQLTSLRRELAALRKDMSKRGSKVYRQGRHMGDDLVDVMREAFDSAVPTVRRSAHAVERSARDNPKTAIATAVVGLAVIGLAATLFSRR